MNLHDLALSCVEIAIEAGNAIELATEAFTVEQKADHSPVTTADLAADKIISKRLANLTPNLAILSEESYESFQGGEDYWCVDPLDGTRDFIHKTGDYTVNIALFEKCVPVIGVVHAPHSHETYFASPEGAYKLVNDQPQKISVRANESDNLVALISRFHPNPNLVKILESIPNLDLMQRGSAIKLCKVADGSADIYPRLSPCKIWDIAAAHCILKAAGGELVTLQNKPFDYRYLTSPWKITGFFAHNRSREDWHFLLDKFPQSN